MIKLKTLLKEYAFRDPDLKKLSQVIGVTVTEGGSLDFFQLGFLMIKPEKGTLPGKGELNGVAIEKICRLFKLTMKEILIGFNEEDNEFEIFMPLHKFLTFADVT